MENPSYVVFTIQPTPTCANIYEKLLRTKKSKICILVRSGPEYVLPGGLAHLQVPRESFFGSKFKIYVETIYWEHFEFYAKKIFLGVFQLCLVTLSHFRGKTLLADGRPWQYWPRHLWHSITLKKSWSGVILMVQTCLCLTYPAIIRTMKGQLGTQQLKYMVTF